MARSVCHDFDGYRVGDITYCIEPRTDVIFPVKIVAIGRRFADAASCNDDLTAAVAAEFNEDPSNRRFLRPRLPPRARFGGFDERLVNSERAAGPELRLLPCHYNTVTSETIRTRHAQAPELWPLPTGVLRERWFS